MTDEIFSLLLDKRTEELSDKAGKDNLSQTERAELRALWAHRDKTPAVAHRIRILSAKMAQPHRWGLLALRFSRKFRQNLAELEALVQYGHSRAVWEIAYLLRKKAAQKLSDVEKSELNLLTTYHDCRDVLEITQLKLKEQFGQLSEEETRTLSELHRNLYRHGQPHQMLDLIWSDPQSSADFTGIR